MNKISTYAADCCAVLLRGGKSRRMGQDKALLPWGDSTFLKTVAGQMDFLLVFLRVFIFLFDQFLLFLMVFNSAPVLMLESMRR